jgi:hypothetical protein
MEILATNRLDGGVFIISSRTAAYRTAILKTSTFETGFQDEYINTFLGRIGPLNADDDNFIMRWLVTNDWKIWIQNDPQALMETTINNPWSTFKQQLLRWARTTWRSNPRSLWEGKIGYTQPWSLYAIYISLLLNFAIVWDPVLLYTLQRAAINHEKHNRATAFMTLWIVCSKVVKFDPSFTAPSDGYPSVACLFCLCILSFVYQVLRSAHVLEYFVGVAQECG